MKTYSVAIQNKNGDWITNIGKHFVLNDIDWQEVRQHPIQKQPRVNIYAISVIITLAEHIAAGSCSEW